MDREYKSFPAFIRSADDRTVKQIFSVFGVIDSYRDRINKGAFKKTLKERMEKIKVLWQHDFWLPPIATLHDAYEIDANDLPEEVLKKFPEATGGLEGVVEYLSTPRGDEVLEGINKKAITENSIGFDAIKTKWVEHSVTDGVKVKIREISEIRLWDLSPVNWGANPATFNRNQKMFERLFEQLSGILVETGETPPFEVIQLSRAVDDLLNAPYASELTWFNELRMLNEAIMEAEPGEAKLAARTHFELMRNKAQALTHLVESYGG